MSTLWVRGNRLTSIPDTIENLTNIRPFNQWSLGLDLSNNRLTVLPPRVLSNFKTDEAGRHFELKITELLGKGLLKQSGYRLDLSGNPIQ